MTRTLFYASLGLVITLAPQPLHSARAAGVRTGQTSVVVHTPASRYPLRGARSAPLNVIYWAGFKNDTTKQVQLVLNQLLARFKGQVRLQFLNKYRDQSYYIDERYAAAVAREAFEQGGDRLFWRLHDAFCKVPSMYSLNKASIDAVARAAGLNMRRLGQAMSSGQHTKAIAAERDLAVRLGVPNYNSSVVLLIGDEIMYISRWTQFHYIEQRVRVQLKKAVQYARTGLSPGQIHRQQLEDAKKRYQPWRRYSHRYRPRISKAYSKRHNIDVSHSPSKGPKTAWVTVVAFLDFTDYTSYNAWQNSLLPALLRHKDKLRLVFKAMPRRYYSYALGAARAAYAAHAQGKFWELAKILFQNRWRLYPSQLKAYARQAGLDVPRWTRDSRSPLMSQRVLKDMQLARQLGITNAPVVFINGRRMPGRYWNQYNFEAALKKELKGGLLSRWLGR
ncbi:MAG: DsbA family protein [bacterium]